MCKILQKLFCYVITDRYNEEIKKMFSLHVKLSDMHRKEYNL